MKSLRTKQTIDWYLGGACLFVLKPLVLIAGKLLKRNHTLGQPPKQIVVFKLLGGGSLVLAYGFLMGLKEKYPQSKITLITTRSVRPFAEILGVFDSIDCIDDRSLISMTTTSFRAIVKNFRPTLWFDLEVYSRLSAVFSILSMAQNRIGFYLENVFWRRGIYTHLIFFNRFSFVPFFYEQMGYLVGAKPLTFSEQTEAFTAAFAIPHSQNVKSISNPIAIGPVCSDLGRERMLTSTQWIEILKKETSSAPRQYYLLGGSADHSYLKQLSEILKSEFRQDTFHLVTDRPLRESLTVLRSCQKFIGIDSGILHISRLLGLSTESYWGPTDPQSRIEPRPQLDQIHYNKIPCSPCVHVSESPPCRGNNVCIAGLFETVDLKRLPIIFYPKDQVGEWPHSKRADLDERDHQD